MAPRLDPSLPPLALAPERSALVGVAGRLEEILLSHLLKDNQFSVHMTDTTEQILALLKQYSFDVILLDNRLPGIQQQGYQPLMKALKAIHCSTPVIGLLMAPSQPLDNTGLHTTILSPLTQEKLQQALKDACPQKNHGSLNKYPL